jgi:hypothetical protein
VSIFPLGLSQNLEAEGKMRGVGRNGRLKILGCEAATICGGRPGLFPLANDAGRGEPQLNGLTVKPVSGEVLAVERVVCDRPCADPVLKRPSESLAWVVAVAFLKAQARTVARTVSPYRAREGCEERRRR